MANAHVTYTAHTIAAALAGKVAAWQMFASQVAAGLALEALATDVRAEIARLPIPTNTRKGAGKTLSNYVSLIRRAEAAKVAFFVEGKALAVRAIEAACLKSEGGGVEASEESTDEGKASEEGKGTESTATVAPFTEESPAETAARIMSKGAEYAAAVVVALQKAIAEASGLAHVEAVAADVVAEAEAATAKAESAAVVKVKGKRNRKVAA